MLELTIIGIDIMDGKLFKAKSRTLNYLMKNIRMETGFVFQCSMEPKPVSKIINADVRILNKDDFSRLPEALKEINPDVKQKLEKGNLCFGAFLDGKCVHMNWVSFSDSYLTEIERTISIDRDSAYMLGTYTLPEYRNRGLYNLVMGQITHYVNKMGFKRLYVIVGNNNSAMLTAQEKANSRKIGTVAFFKFFNIKLYRLKAERKEDYQALRHLFK